MPSSVSSLRGFASLIPGAGLRLALLGWRPPLEPPTTLATRGQGDVDSLSPGWGGGWWGGEGSQIKSRSLSLGTKHPESLLPGALPHSSLPYASCVRGPGLWPYLKGRGVGDKSSGTPFPSQAAAFFFFNKGFVFPNLPLERLPTSVAKGLPPWPTSS